MIGITLLKVTNTGGSAVGGIPPNQSAVFMEGQVAGIVLNQIPVRTATTNTPAGSVPGVKAKISNATVRAATDSVFTASATITIELGTLDNDGYFNVYLSSY